MSKQESRLRSGAVLLTCLGLASCTVGASDDPPPGPIRDFAMVGQDGGDMSMVDSSGGPTLAKACGDYAMTFCAKTQTCNPVYLNTAFGDLSTCVARVQSSCNLTVAGSNTTGADWEACNSAYGSGGCEQFNVLMMPTACRTKPGTLTSGAACSLDWQCQSAYCKRDYGLACGSCANVQPLGGGCATDRDCGFGSGTAARCNASKICVAVVGSGATCDATHICDNKFTCKSNSCVALAPVDGACTMTSDCDGTTCINNKCKAGSYAASGMACGYIGSNMPYTWCSKGYCWGNPTGTCVGYHDDGTACDLSMAQYCVYPAECMAGTCKIPGASSCM